MTWGRIMPDVQGRGSWTESGLWIIDCLYCGEQYGYWPHLESSDWWNHHQAEHVANQMLNSLEGVTV